MNTQHLSEQEIVRREKLAELTQLGIDAFPAPLYPVTHHSAAIKKLWAADNSTPVDVVIAGRLMSVRDMGKANFFVLQDAEGKIQCYIKQDDICPAEDKTLYQTILEKKM